MKLAKIISCPTPKQVESEDILNVQEKAQAYFDETIAPVLKEAVYTPQPITGHLRYAAYVEAALKDSGWIIRWDKTLKSDVIERKPKFKLNWPKICTSAAAKSIISVFTLQLVLTVMYLSTLIIYKVPVDVLPLGTLLISVCQAVALLFLAIFINTKD